MHTHMRREIDEIPDAVARLLDGAAALERAGAALRERNPAYVATIARGSSDHAAHFLKYAIELVARRPVASIGPSLASIYGVTLDLSGAATIAISQSGKSPDIVAMADAATRSGAESIALTNTMGSPLADASRHAIDIAAGPELAVAATKSYVSSVFAGLILLSEWTGNEELRAALRAAPGHFARAVRIDWLPALAADLTDASSLYMLGRGPTLAIASEAALKFKETSGLHAEAYSAAEVLHGPVALVKPEFPVIAFAAADAAEASIADIADGLAEKRAAVYATSARTKRAGHLERVETGHPLTDALALIIPFYGFVEAWSRSLGFNPDKPEALKKVTETR
ncbi:SIS domain-containing protein [Gellertiella hungarica]|uniref:Glucosamine--fructose-6-phosphate aminotransferase (Isomerizing) n=1 Tax=Gellertiella hungarica TaxID=1572859 RepID=A0A7W6J2I8_9HYPH|nr:SIS domain-containing protein [Gellertiella hungarica]MBB4062912.1 glucosamine--fructose-6-phosphate aminotransferase (isomerizing) [Gellertiella hungarica]